VDRLAEHLRYELAGDAFEESFARGAELATGELLIDLDGCDATTRSHRPDGPHRHSPY
jgi:hypothetical protein